MIILGTNSIKDTGYNVDNSARFDGTTAYLNRTPGSASNRKTFTFSTWIKRSGIAGVTVHQDIFSSDAGDDESYIHFDTDSLKIFSTLPASAGGAAGDPACVLITTQKFRDFSAWMHIVVAVDTTQGTASNRVKLYINGTQVTSFSTETYPDQNYQFATNAAVAHMIARRPAGSKFLPGYLAETVLIDGSQLAPTSFGEFDEDSGIWKPIDVSGLTFGTNGFYLDYEDSGDLGDDESGNGNDFTENNLAAIDQSTDTCTNNFATWNSLQPTNATMTEGNLVGASSASSGHYSGLSTIGVTSGKWYFECKQIQESTTGEGIIGAVIFYNTVTALLNPEGRGGAWGIKAQGRGFQTDSGGSGSTTNSFTAGWSNNDTIGIALDIDNSRIYFSKGGQWNNSGSWNAANPTTSQTLQNALGDGTYFFFAGDASGSNNNTWSANFGSPAYAISSGNTDGNGYGNFEYAPPSNYFALNTKNLAEYG